MKNINQQIRNTLSRHLNQYLEKGDSLYEAACKYVYTLYQFQNSDNLLEKIGYELFVYIMYLDAYKLKSYQQKEMMNNDTDTDFFNQLIEIEDAYSLLAEVSADPSFLVRLIEECYTFHQMNGLGKINVVKSLSAYENELLEQEYPMHKQDLKSYDIQVRLQHITKNIENQARHQMNQFGVIYEDTITLSLVGFVRNLLKNDYQNAMELILEIATSDYMCTKLLVQTNQTDSMLQEHISFYENSDKNEIFNQFIEYQEFLMDALWNITDVYVYQEYGNVPIDKGELDEKAKQYLLEKLT